MKLAWNAIVKNESARIERCLRSLLPHIDFGIVVDTGSTDNTIEIIQRLFDEAGKPVEITTVPFENFEQARNAALDAARYTSNFDWDYLFLVDADMELVVKDPNWVSSLDGGESYNVEQISGVLSYYNRRLVSRKATGSYIGVTHEYLDIASAGEIDSIYFIDHADGANRKDKCTRDIELLEKALETEPREGIRQRYTFYLAQSYFDSQQWSVAAQYYAQRTKMGGYAEEVWVSQVRYAHCLGNMGLHADFVAAMLEAYTLRPQRAESLYDLAKYYRFKGENYVSLLFSEAGMKIPKPKHDLLFINDYVYDTGLREEFAICAYYDEAKRWHGAAVCNHLATDPKGFPSSRDQARTNMYWYLRPLEEYVRSFHPTMIEIKTARGYVPMNPSVTNFNGKLVGIVRTVNYTITPDGYYVIRKVNEDGTENYSASNPIDTRNLLVEFNSNSLEIKNQRELISPLPAPKFPYVIGFEDCRLFEWPLGRLATISTVRELTPEGWCEQVFAPINEPRFIDPPNEPILFGDDWRVIRPKHRQNEKNWVPFISFDRLQFMYRPGVLIDLNGDITDRQPMAFELENVSGGSQVVRVGNCIYLAIVHEARNIPGKQTRYYQHRFIRYDEVGRVVAVSPPFFFFGRQIEFAAGLAYFPHHNYHQLILSFGIRDCEAWLASLDVDEVLRFIAGRY